ncbi:MAG: tetratricopeptide repeat protein [Cytophagales bacterium]|nr:tetratricopeptide repeat protein [Cytophagales bacterium]
MSPPVALTVDQLIDQSAQQYQAGQFELALATSQQAIAREMQHAMAWNNAAAALAVLGRWVDALAYSKQALALAPQSPEAQTNGAHILAQLGLVDQATAMLRNLGWAQHLAGQREAAMATYERAIAIQPNDVESLHVLAGLHSEGKNTALALALMARVLEINPQHLNTLAAKGNLLGEQTEQGAAAEACFQTALQISPDHWMTLYNYGVFLAGARRYPEAIAMYERAGRADPDHHLSFWNLSNLLLRLGDYARAWPLYEWRWKTDHLKPAYLELPMPLWTGQDLQGKRILLHFEQGYGDAFQFIRLAKNVAERGAHVTIFMPREICENFVGVAGVHAIRPWSETLQGFDYHAPLMSLPAPLGLSVDNIPVHIPYLFANQERMSRWQDRLPPLHAQQKLRAESLDKPRLRVESLDKPTLRVGVAWCGRPTHDNDGNRSLAFAALLPLLEAFPQVQFISMQVGPRESDLPALDACQSIVRVESDIQDFSDTAALAMQLDLLISVDTSVVHLAAALGKPVWVLLAASSDWRWLEDREDTPWYPNVRLFRQSIQDGRVRDWTRVLTRIQSALTQLLLTEQAAKQR